MYIDYVVVIIGWSFSVVLKLCNFPMKYKPLRQPEVLLKIMKGHISRF